MKRLLPLLLPLLLLGPLYAHGAYPVSAKNSPLLRVSEQTISLEQAAAQVQAEHGGRILAAETVMEEGKAIHVVKILTPNNSVRTVRIPAGNGR